MKLVIRAGGVIRRGPERELIDDYVSRAGPMTRQVGFTSLEEQQVDLRNCKTRKDETLQMLGQDQGKNMGKIVVLDERGKSMKSRAVSKQLARWRDDGEPQVTFLIGGADGFEPNALPTNVTFWSFGAQTWPHKLVRVLLAEQVYRALSILAGTPYHRD